VKPYPPKATFTENHISVTKVLHPQIFTCARE